jgi:predicted dehydrogenase/threonine dehydrogenase-like Zn-dependent dehydrogenase
MLPPRMRQLQQDISSGAITMEAVPAPARGPADLLVATRASLISAGTERALVELGRKSLAGKARARPDLVRKVLETAREEGVAATARKVRGRLEEPNALGYSSCGVVLEAPDGSPAGPGELVACAGAGLASHAEIVAVPRTLCARVPENVPPEDAAYATVAAIALHGVRLTELKLGEVAVVIGLGLVGQLTLELVTAAGGVALGLDPDEGRVELARAAGSWAATDVADLVEEGHRRTAGRGADAALVTAASRSAQPLTTAVAAARERARICIVGDVPVEVPRNDLFAKELSLVVSRSYGPGRYDPVHEELGQDYPAAYVRWTEGRNLEEVLRLMSTGALRPSRLTTHSFDLADGPAAYELLESDEPSLGILLRYPEAPATERRVVVPKSPRLALRRTRGRPRLGVIGAGTFARSVLLPALAGDVDIATVVTARGASAKSTAARFGAGVAATDPAAVLEDPAIDAVLIATRHDTHASYAAQALRAGKHVFVEKPLGLGRDELAEIEAALADERAGTLTVGFNRRFAPMSRELRDALGGRGPLLVHIRVNAGRLPRTHWVHDPLLGGGRIAGEGCHFVDLAAFLCGGAPDRVVSAVALEGSSEPREDSFAATLAFPGGSIATIHYSALGDPSLAKERVEVLGEAGAGVIDDFRRLELHRHGAREERTSARDKGHAAELRAFLQAIRTGVPAQDPSELLAVSRATLDVRDAVAG